MRRPPNCFSVSELSVYLDVSVNTLQRWRNLGTGPEFFRHGMKLVFYPKKAVHDWERHPMIQKSTAENRTPLRDPGVTQRKRT